jgi:metallo-beta-lactamase class B
VTSNFQRWGLFCPCLVLVVFHGIAFSQNAALPCTHCAEWNRPQAPFRIFGSTYYVGTHGLSSLLITSDSGHVLIDADLPESVPQIVEHIRKLGFRIQDVKLILNSHVHYDHAGGIAEVQRLSGARVVASPWSAAVMENSGLARDDPQYGAIAPIPLVHHVDQLHDGEDFHIGGVTLTAHLTPGHTPGGTSWTWKSCENKVCRAMVYADSVTPVSADGYRFTDGRKHPMAIADFEKTFAFLESTPCEILITAHPEASGLWDRLEARERSTTPDPMVSVNACRQLAQHGRDLLQQRIADEHKP